MERASMESASVAAVEAGDALGTLGFTAIDVALIAKAFQIPLYMLGADGGARVAERLVRQRKRTRRNRRGRNPNVR